MESAAADDPPLGKCAVHDLDSWDDCDRCGRFYCDECCGEEPNELFCAECDRALGSIPWERDRSRLSVLSAWWATALAVVERPRATLTRVGEGPLRGPVTFAAMSVALASLLVGAVAALTIEHSGPRDGSRLFGGACIAVGVAVSAALGVAVTVPVLSTFGRLGGPTITRRNAWALASYGTAFLPLLALFPLAAPVAVFAARAIVRGLPRETSRLTATLIGLAILVAWLVVFVATWVVPLLIAISAT